MLNRNFWLLFINRAFTRIAYHITTFALVVWIFQLTGANIAVSLWMAVFLVASFIASFFSGVAADIYDRRRIMFFSNLAWGMTALTFLLFPQSFPGILLVSFFAQGIDEFFSPAQNSALPQIVASRDLIRANSYLTLVTHISNFLGYFLSGVMLRFIGFPAPFGTAAVLITLGAVATLFLPPLYREGESVPLRKFFGLVKGKLIDQLFYLAKNPNITKTMLIAAVVLSVSAGAGSLAPGFAEQVLAIDARDLSFVAVLPIGLGLFLGAAILGRRGRLLAVWKGILGVGLILLALSAAPFFRVFLGNHITVPRAFEQVPFFSLAIASLSFLLGFFAAVITIPIVTSIQRIAPGKHLGRTFAAMGTVSSILTPAVTLIFGPIADLSSPVVPMVSIGLIVSAAAFWVRARVVIK
uniref:MFS transporter n=1 Tax=candidate division WWE3 bacterium TaxID=2053526 RepID=A0A832E0K6_UNCKA